MDVMVEICIPRRFPWNNPMADLWLDAPMGFRAWSQVSLFRAIRPHWARCDLRRLRSDRILGYHR